MCHHVLVLIVNDAHPKIPLLSIELMELSEIRQVVSVVDAQDLNCVIQPASYVKKVCDKLPRLWDEENIVSWMTCLDLQVL